MRGLHLGNVRKELAPGGYEIMFDSAGLELGVYELVDPDPDRQLPHEDYEIYVVLEGSGVLEVEGREIRVDEGDAVFVAAGAEHRFRDYERLSLLVVFERRRA